MNLMKFLARTGRNQAEIAKFLDTTPGNVNRWAKNEGVPSYEKCAELLKLGMTIEELFDKETAEKYESMAAAKKVTQDEITEMVKKALASLISA